MRRLKTAREVVDALGGIEAVATMTRAQPKTVYHWTGRNDCFPSRTFDTMKAALKRRHLHAPAKLWNQLPPPNVV